MIERLDSHISSLPIDILHVCFKSLALFVAARSIEYDYDLLLNFLSFAQESMLEYSSTFHL